MPRELTTPRLLMRATRAGDRADLVALHEDAAVEKVFGATTPAEVVEWIEASLREWSERGHGRLLIYDREDGAFLGRAGLRWWPEFDELEVGWTLTAAARGRGVATEAGQASLDWGFRDFGVPYITAMISPDNAASLAVARRLGMERIRDDVLMGVDVGVYAAFRDGGAAAPPGPG